MGTGKSGRYLNTEGSATSVSDFALVHSDEGKLYYDSRNKKMKLGSGGHGQKGLEYLERLNIEHKITKVYSNGVRVGNVKDHFEKNKRKGDNQSWFPKEWTTKDIKKAGEYVMSLKTNRENLKDGKSYFGTYRGVRVGVKLTDMKISTIFPDAYKQPNKINRTRRKC